MKMLVRRLVATFWVLVANMANTASGDCADKFGGNFDQLKMMELGGALNEGDVLRLSVEDFSDITIDDSSELSPYFSVTKEDQEWVLGVEATLTDWYDKEQGWGKVDSPYSSLSIKYTCSATGSSETYPHDLWVVGENNRDPTFYSSSYTAQISKTIPQGVPLDYVLDIQVTDDDFVCSNCASYPDLVCKANCQSNDLSSNVISCEVSEDPENVIECMANMVPGNPGSYTMSLSLKRSIQNLDGLLYTLKITAKDERGRSSEAEVILTFPPEDLMPPIFSQGGLYTASAPIDSDMDSVSGQQPLDIDVDIVAADGDTTVGAEILFSIVLDQGTCSDCFQLSGKTLQLVKGLGQDAIRNRLATVMIQAQEQTDLKKTSTAVVNIPIIGDDNNPLLNKIFFSHVLDIDGLLEGVAPMTVTDQDSLIKDNTYTFKLLSDNGMDAFFKLDVTVGKTSATLSTLPGLDLANLPPEGVVSFMVEVTDEADLKKSSRSLITVTYDPSATTPDPDVTTACPVTTDEPCDCTTQPINTPDTTPDPDVTTTCPEPTDEPCECTTQPVNTPDTTCPEPTDEPCDCTTKPATTTATTPLPGDEKLSFTSGDHGAGEVQNVGYPGFIPLENAVRNPLARVKAECNNPNYNSYVTYSLDTNQDKFYLDQGTGEVFLTNPLGQLTVSEVCQEACSLDITARLTNLNVESVTITVKIYGLAVEEVLVFDYNKDYTEADQAVVDINSDAGDESDVWFRLLNVQPRELSRKAGGTFKMATDSVLFMSGFKAGEENRFINTDEAASTISSDGLSTDTDVEVDHHSNAEEGGGGWRTATIVMAVILTLLVVGAVILAVFLKRGSLMKMVSRVRPKKEDERLTNSGENSISASSGTIQQQAVEAKPEKTGRNSNGFLNLQSVTIQTNNPRGGSGVPAGNTQVGLMREMSTELEKRLEKKGRGEKEVKQQENMRAKPPTRLPPGPGLRKGPAPVAPGVKFNEGVEVVEVEQSRRSSRSSSDSSSDSDSSSSSGSGSSESDSGVQESVTRI